jgi:hypothetical protein
MEHLAMLAIIFLQGLQKVEMYLDMRFRPGAPAIILSAWANFGINIYSVSSTGTSPDSSVSSGSSGMSIHRIM